MEPIIDNELYERIYFELEDYGRAEYNHCPGIRLYPHYFRYLAGKIMDLGSGTGETVQFFRKHGFEAFGLDWIEPRNEYCKKANVTLKNQLDRYNVITCFDVIEHLTNGQIKGLFRNMTFGKIQIFTIANSSSTVTLNDGTTIDLHINKKPFSVWRGIILDYFDILKVISIRQDQTLYICKRKGEPKRYLNYLVKVLRANGYTVRKDK